MSSWRTPPGDGTERDSDPGTTVLDRTHLDKELAARKEELERKRVAWHEPETVADSSSLVVPPPRATQDAQASEARSPGLPFRTPPSSPPPAPPVVMDVGPSSVAYGGQANMNQTVVFEAIALPPRVPSFPPAPAAPEEPPASVWLPGQTIGQRMRSQPPEREPSSDVSLPGGVARPHASAGAASDSVLSPVVASAAPHAEPVVLHDEVPDLLWHEPSAMSRLRVWHKDLLARQAPIAFDDRHAPVADSPAELKARSEVLAVLTQAGVEAGPLGAVALGSEGSMGHFGAPLVVVEGMLRFSFAEVEELRALAAEADLHRLGHTDLGATIDEARRLLDGNGGAGAARVYGRALGALRSRIRSTLGEGAARRIESDVEGALLEQRSYKKRRFLDAEWLRTSFRREHEETVAYLPSSLAEKLPLFASMRCRAIAEVIPPQDQFEAGPLALRITALARLLPRSVFARS